MPMPREVHLEPLGKDALSDPFLPRCRGFAFHFRTREEPIEDVWARLAGRGEPRGNEEAGAPNAEPTKEKR
jgi:hypothetical protein